MAVRHRPTSGQTLEVKDASGQSSIPLSNSPPTVKKKGFAINVTKNTGYSLWLGNEQLMDSKGTTVFTATEDKLVSFSGMTTLPADWPAYARVANVGTVAPMSPSPAQTTPSRPPEASRGSPG